MAKTIAFDLDDVMCHRPRNVEHLGIQKYDFCVPDHKAICVVNMVYESGHRVLIYTSRGMTQLKGNLSEIERLLRLKTEDQLRTWGVKYHELIFGKIHYDMLVDDKALNSKDINRIFSFLGGDV
jgi:hypothetical protein